VLAAGVATHADGAVGRCLDRCSAASDRCGGPRGAARTARTARAEAHDRPRRALFVFSPSEKLTQTQAPRVVSGPVAARPTAHREPRIRRPPPPTTTSCFPRGALPPAGPPLPARPQRVVGPPGDGVFRPLPVAAVAAGNAARRRATQQPRGRLTDRRRPGRRPARRRVAVGGGRAPDKRRRGCPCPFLCIFFPPPLPPLFPLLLPNHASARRAPPGRPWRPPPAALRRSP